MSADGLRDSGSVFVIFLLHTTQANGHRDAKWKIIKGIPFLFGLQIGLLFIYAAKEEPSHI